ncbi:hypothetical protein B0H13DRAFT_1913517 [Mycena leptocephala]|nr:hypothetical protein B0H13DRAFT_1913517 [Mycena leptocephala]
MDILCFDQHDKWKRFGLWLHLGIEPYSGWILWLKIWWTNRNPKLVTSYYLDGCRKAGGMYLIFSIRATLSSPLTNPALGIPLITQSDLGTENYGIANCHTVTRQRLDPSLEGTMQHQWMKEKMNIKPEATWSQMRRQFTPGFETIMDKGVARGLYNVDKPLEKLVFRWLAIPWLQAELDAWVRRYNSTPRRRDKNKILPQGIPDLIVAKPHLYGTQELQGRGFWLLLTQTYEYLGHRSTRTIRRDARTFWDVYCAVLERIVQVDEDLTTGHDAAFMAPMELLAGQKELRQGDNAVAGYEYYGGLAKHPQSQDENDNEDGGVVLNFADLTDQED